MAVSTVPPQSPPPAPQSLQQRRAPRGGGGSVLSRQSNHSSSSFGSISCITVRKDDPSDQAGLQLEQTSTGRVVVKSIAANGLFADSGLKIGDVVLSVNKKKLSSVHNGPEVLIDAVRQNTAISITIKKPVAESPPNRRSKKAGKSLLGKSPRGRSKTKKKKAPGNDNNSIKIDTFYDGMARHNPDGSLAFARVGELSSSEKDDATATAKQTLTISASKPYGPPDRRTSHSKLTGWSQSQSLHAQHRKRLSSVTGSNSKKGPIVGLVLEVVDKKLIVRDVHFRSIFCSTRLRVGDIVLSINDMSFRRYPDADYATTIMEKARLMVTLVVERAATEEKADDDTSRRPQRKNHDQSFSDSISTFGNDFSLDDTDHDSKNSLLGSSGHGSVHNGSFSFHEVIETEFKIEKYRPVTISVPKSMRTEDAGLKFKTIRTSKHDPFGSPTTSSSSDAQPWEDKRTKLTWIYVDDIAPDSIFRDTSLAKGDRVLSINNTDLRERPDPREALQACVSAKEAIAMVVLKGDRTIYKEKGFALDGVEDSSSSNNDNLEWRC